MNPELSLAIPIYNEEDCIEDTVKNLVNEFEKQGIDYEMVLVNHGSVDKTKNILDKLSKDNKKLKVINLAKNLNGAGGGVMYGLDISKGRYMGFTYADEEVSAEDTYRIYLALKKSGYDFAKGKRLKRKDGLIRIISSIVFNVIVNLIFNLHSIDVNGYPVFMKREIYPKLKTKETNYLFTLDILRRARRNKYKILEIPVIHRKRIGGISFMKPARIIEMAIKLFKYSIK
jgi:glycosyltransferase involved in cell wall biosynthesis